MNLYRAAEDDFVSITTCFAADQDDAAEYQDNPGFGGPVLYRAIVDADESRVLRLEGSASECHSQLLELLGYDPMDGGFPGECVGSLLALRSDLVDELIAKYEWVVFTDSYPEDCETWMWISGEEPEMTEL